MEELDVGMQNPSIDICEEAHSLFLAGKCWVMVQEDLADKGLVMVQEEERRKEECKAHSQRTSCTPHPTPIS